MSEIKLAVLEGARESFERVENVGFAANTPASRAACAEQAAKLRAMPHWDIAAPRRVSFYDEEANANPNLSEELCWKTIGRLIGCAAKRAGHASLEPVWKHLGLVDGDPALELIKTKESISSVLQEAQEMQDKAEKEVRAMREEVASAKRKVAEMETLIESTQTRVAEEVAKKNAELKARDAEIGKLRAELQTALARPNTTAAAPASDEVKKLQAQLESTRKLAETHLGQAQQQLTVNAAELVRLKAQVATQSEKIRRYETAVSSQFDEQFITALKHRLLLKPTETVSIFLADEYLLGVIHNAETQASMATTPS